MVEELILTRQTKMRTHDSSRNGRTNGQRIMINQFPLSHILTYADGRASSTKSTSSANSLSVMFAWYCIAIHQRQGFG